MDVLNVIRSRRSIHAFKADPVSREQMTAILSAATWAPNHKLTQPWQFYVISGAAKERLARQRGEHKRKKMPDPSSEKAQQAYERAYAELNTVPYAVMVCMATADDPTRQFEDTLAMGAAVQNMLLAAQSMGIGTFWSSGGGTVDAETLRQLGVPEGQRPVGLIFFGHPVEGEQKVPPRDPVEAHTHWID
ncbi:MAG: nitroreductase [Mycobacterium leprae]